jgi:hypothetical protein
MFSDMARQLAQFPKARRQSKYPWDQWLDGSVWLLRKGEDYETTSPSMRAIATSAAKKEGKRLRTQITVDEDGIEALVIQVREDSS